MRNPSDRFSIISGNKPTSAPIQASNGNSTRARRRGLARSRYATLGTMSFWPDLAHVAGAFGCANVTVRDLDDLDPLAAALAGRDRPLLVHVKLDPDFISRIPR